MQFATVLHGLAPVHDKIDQDLLNPAGVNFSVDIIRHIQLYAYLGGNFEYSVTDNLPVSRGELTLLDGSKLDFIKTFQIGLSLKNPDLLQNYMKEKKVNFQSLLSVGLIKSSENPKDFFSTLKKTIKGSISESQN